ncbi:MAG: 3-dehydroquinate synthase [Chitinophagaceae bacterium]|nr:3-dehydroquinate synthase [Chitinophagaceae bacterium]MCW5927452.1 3-dehydroquinate synthase [Chitinophagaceae bacterium]
MNSVTYKFSNASTQYYFASGFATLKRLVDPKNAIIITDDNIFNAQTSRFKGWNTIVLKPGEEYKVQATVDSIIEQLIAAGADRKTTLIGIGGGVITDITGYTASVYMRGISFGFLPTTVLAMVDAGIGGKNGVDVGVYKNLVGTIRQPGFILYDHNFLNSLPDSEWTNGFAEIIKHACIKDAAMFKELQAGSLLKYRKSRKLMEELIRRNALIKIKVVQKDEFEKGDRRLLNFGHTLGHALENQYELSHGQAISIGMTYASQISAQLKGFRDTEKVVHVLEQYGLPTYAEFDKKKVLEVLKMDKKRERKEMNFVLLDKIGKGVVYPIPLTTLEKIISAL